MSTIPVTNENYQSLEALNIDINNLPKATTDALNSHKTADSTTVQAAVTAFFARDENKDTTLTFNLVAKVITEDAKSPEARSKSTMINSAAVAMTVAAAVLTIIAALGMSQIMAVGSLGTLTALVISGAVAGTGATFLTAYNWPAAQADTNAQSLNGDA